MGAQAIRDALKPGIRENSFFDTKTPYGETTERKIAEMRGRFSGNSAYTHVFEEKVPRAGTLKLRVKG